MVNIKNKQIYVKFFKKNIYNFFFITVIITSILYIYSCNNIIEPNNSIDKTCQQLTSILEPEYIEVADDKQGEINSDKNSAAMAKAATISAVRDGGLIQRKLGNGSGDIPRMIRKFIIENNREYGGAAREYRHHGYRDLRLQSNKRYNDQVRKYYNRNCINTNRRIENNVGHTGAYLIEQAKKI